MTQRRLPVLLMAALIGASTLSADLAAAQTPLPMEEDPLDDRSRRRLDRMEKVLRELRSVVFQGRDTGRPVVVQFSETEVLLQGLMTRVGDLEASLQRLNGTNETLTFELSQARRQVDQLQADNAQIMERLRAVEALLAEEQAAASDAQAAATEDPAAAFGRARQLMLDGDYDGAETAFQRFVQHHGETEQGAEARYWLGKTLTARGAHSDAAGAYIGAIRGWPKTAWAPDAVVELSRALVALKRPEDACKTLGEFDKRYPKAPPAVAGRAASTRAQAKCGA